ncbi:MAG: YSIRK-type signal peptide-containing protein, partial [Anaerococcus sp.]|nr:YSIRK-type signal peptide-containing protein [Anaerococcus sp.]
MDKLLEYIKHKKEKSSNRKPKYATRKLSIGLVSCMLGFLIFTNEPVAFADQENPVTLTEEEAAALDSLKGTEKDAAEGEEPVETTPAAVKETEVAPAETKKLVEEPEAKEEFKLTAEQVASLEEVGYTDEEIASIEDEAKARKEADENFDVDAFVAQKVADKTPTEEENKVQPLVGKGADPEAEEDLNALEIGSNKPEESKQQAVSSEGIATRDAALPEESEVSADARDAVHGWVGVQRTGDVNLNYENQIGKAFLPIEGVKVYFQWYEDGGKVSPVYTATSGSDGRFHIGMKPYVDKDGNFIKFDADTTVSGGNERYRFWVDETTIPEGYQLQYITGESVIFPDSGLPITQGGASSSTTRNTHNNWKVLLMEKPKPTMHRENATETPLPVNSGGQIKGGVYYDYKSNVGGIQWGTLADRTTPVEGVVVRASYLSDFAMKKIYSNEVATMLQLDSIDKIRGTGWSPRLEDTLQNWIRGEVEKDPTNWIAETVTAKTNAEGQYIIQFNGLWGFKQNKGAREYSSTDVLGFSEEEKERIGTLASNPNDGSFADTALNKNEKHINYDWTYVSVDGTENLRVWTPYNDNYYTGWGGSQANWGKITSWYAGLPNNLSRTIPLDFYLAPGEIKFNITNYDTNLNTAMPGDTGITDTQGLPYFGTTSDTFRIVWED